MRLFACSDLHIDTMSPEVKESFNFPDADVYLIAGDLMNGVEETHYDWLFEKTRGIRTILCPGNHDYYGLTRESAFEQIQSYCQGTHLECLLDTSVALAPDLHLWASDIWTDFEVSGSANEAFSISRTFWGDFDRIFKQERDNRLLEPADVIEWHQHSMDKLLTFCEQTAGTLIVMTHHGLVEESLCRSLSEKPLNAEDAFFTSEYKAAICSTRNPPALLINGHMHRYTNVELSDQTILLCNPRGSLNSVRTTFIDFDNETGELTLLEEEGS